MTASLKPVGARGERVVPLSALYHAANATLQSLRQSCAALCLPLATKTLCKQVPALARLCVITASVKPVGARGERVVPLLGLSPKAAATVFCRAASREFSPAELRDGASPHTFADAMQVLQ